VALLFAVVACGDRKQAPPPPPSVPDALGRSADAAALAADTTWPELRGFATEQPSWLVELAPLAPRPELVAHAPVVVGDRVLVAGSRTDYRALDLDTGAEAWHRPGGAALSKPVVYGPTDVILVHACDGAVGAPLGRAVLACFDRVDPFDISVRSAGRIHVDEERWGECATGTGAWKPLNTNPRSLGLLRGRCLFNADLEADGAASRLLDPPPERELTDDIVAVIDGATWRQVINAGQSFVERYGAPPIAGLTVLAAAHENDRGAVVVRLDSSLSRDYLAAYDTSKVLWVWPLPPPPDPAGRAGPIGVHADAANILVFFDGSRVARFTAPWARPTSN
jgi:hypothetical protein